MPFTLQSSGDKKSVVSQVNGQITASFDQAPKGPDREDTKRRMEKIRDYLFNELGADFPDESPTGLVLVGDAGKNYISITQLQFSLSMPPKAADTEANPVPDKKEVTEMIPPAPDKKPVPVEESSSAPTTSETPNTTGGTPATPVANAPAPTIPAGPPTTTGKF